mgnify:CR=1 FL=1
MGKTHFILTMTNAEISDEDMEAMIAARRKQHKSKYVNLIRNILPLVFTVGWFF